VISKATPPAAATIAPPPIRASVFLRERVMGHSICTISYSFSTMSHYNQAAFAAWTSLHAIVTDFRPPGRRRRSCLSSPRSRTSGASTNGACRRCSTTTRNRAAGRSRPSARTPRISTRSACASASRWTWTGGRPPRRWWDRTTPCPWPWRPWASAACNRRMARSRPRGGGEVRRALHAVDHVDLFDRGRGEPTRNPSGSRSTRSRTTTS
jgi:hypothetical protein